MAQIRDEIRRDIPSRPHETRSSTDVQRIRLEKLMKNPEKPVLIPEKPNLRGPPVVPDFVRNVMGSSAGAGSGEFHVYRHLRRKEYARQNYLQKRAEWEQLEDNYHVKIAENKRKAEEETAKKRAKRLKKKQNNKNRKSAPTKKKETESEEETSEDEAETSQGDSQEASENDSITTSNSDEHNQPESNKTVEESNTNKVLIGE